MSDSGAITVRLKLDVSEFKQALERITAALPADSRSDQTRCPAIDNDTDMSCDLPLDHDGLHRATFDWADQP